MVNVYLFGCWFCRLTCESKTNVLHIAIQTTTIHWFAGRLIHFLMVNTQRHFSTLKQFSTTLTLPALPDFLSALSLERARQLFMIYDKRARKCYELKIGRCPTVFENHRKSLIQHCERSELSLHFEWTKVY